MSSSGGLAAHVNRQRAIAHGILELIERDAVNLSWYSRVLPQRIEMDVTPCDPQVKKWLDSAWRAGIDVVFYSHTTDVPDVYIVTAIAIEPDLEQNCYVAGGGAGFTVESAIRAAMAELVQAERMVRISELAPNWQIVMGLERMFGIEPDATEADFQNFIQVVSYYGYPENQKILDWYLRSPDQPVIKLSELKQRERVPGARDAYSAVLDVCKRAGLTPIVFDFTPDHFQYVSLQKVFIPELVPAFPPNVKMLGHERYYTFPMRLGVLDRRLEYEELTKDPLPYP